jgi:TolB-like protein
MSDPAPSVHSDHDVDARLRTAAPASSWARIKEHKIIQWALGYLAAALALTHAEELVARAFDWPEFISRALIVVLALGLPIVITLAWYHGHRASRHVTGAEATIIAILLLMGAGFLWLFVRPHQSIPVVTSTTQPGGRAIPVTGKPRIAILPFDNLSPDPNNAFFTDGLHEEILTALANSAPGLDVISRTTMMTYRIAPKPVVQVARELGATHVLEGSVRRDGEDVRVTLQLIDAHNDDHLWAQNYDRKLTKAMALESEIAREVASLLSAKLSSIAGRSTPTTTDSQAYDLYLKARLQLQAISPATPIEFLHATELLLTRAIERDPAFAFAYLERSTVRLNLFAINYDSRQEVLDAARADLDAAERLSANDPRCLTSEAILAALDYQYAHALSLVSAAEAAGITDANSAAVRAAIAFGTGRYEDAIQAAERSAALDPANATTLGTTASYYAVARHPAEALRMFGLAGERQPAFAPDARNIQDYIRWSFAGDRAALTRIAELRVAGWGLRPQIGDNYRKSRNAVEALPVRAPMRADFAVPIGVGKYPMRALYQGRLDFLLGDRAGAAKDGGEILTFVGDTKLTRRNGWLLKVLTSYAKMYQGEKPATLAAAHEALALAPRSLDAVDWATASAMLAPVLAWSGAQDEAAAMLDELSTSVPGMSPAAIARDALIATTLSGNARYKALQAKLEAQMAATKLE